MLMGWVLYLPLGLPDPGTGRYLEQGFRLPDFQGVWQRPDLWVSVLLLVITLTLIDGVESLATIAGIDKIDPFRRRSDPNRTLRAMGISNMLSSLAGGLTIIPGGMKSTTNIVAGGRTLWANGYYGLFMALMLWMGTGLINRIPLATLAALLIYVGWRLCEPRVFRKVLTVGKEQLLIFVVTMAVTLLETDLLVGIVVGMLTKLTALSFHLVQSSLTQSPTGRFSLGQFTRLLSAAFAELFGSPVIRIGDGRGTRERYSVMSVASSAIRGSVGDEEPIQDLPVFGHLHESDQTRQGARQDRRSSTPPKPTSWSSWQDRLSTTRRWSICTTFRINASKPVIPAPSLG